VIWIEQQPHPSVVKSTPIHILVSDDEYVAFISVEVDGFRAMVPKPKGDESLSYFYTHDTLQEVKDWCIAELWKRRLDQ
jgi:hypothetical protein